MSNDATPNQVVTPPAVKVSGLSKRYRIARSPSTGGVYDSIGRLLRRRNEQAARSRSAPPGARRAPH